MSPSDADPNSRTPGALESAQMGRKHIFCVNGSSDFLEVLRALFEDERYNVTTTNYVPNTFEQIAALRPDGIILDLEVTHKASWALMEKLTADAATHAIPVIITSTDRQLLDTAAAESLRYGEHVALIKPLDIEALLAEMQRLIGGA